ncbi:unnamed protein product [Diamesa serratosioi]
MFDFQNYQLIEKQLAAESKDLDKVLLKLKSQYKAQLNKSQPTKWDKYSQRKMLQKSYTFKLPPAPQKVKDRELIRTFQSDDINHLDYEYVRSNSMGHVNEDYLLKNETRRRMRRATELGNRWMKDKKVSTNNKPKSPTQKEINLKEIKQRRSIAIEMSKKWYRTYFGGSTKVKLNVLDLQDEQKDVLNGIYGISTLMNIHNEVILQANKIDLVDNINESSNAEILTTFNDITESSLDVNNHENEINELINVIITDVIKQIDNKEKGIDRLRKLKILKTFETPSVVRNSKMKNNSKFNFFQEIIKINSSDSEKFTTVTSLINNSITSV